jgi:hypothetical protein
MNKILTVLLALGAVATTQAELHNDDKIKHLDHCMDALGKSYADLNEGRGRRHCEKAVNIKTWGELKGKMDNKHQKDAINRYMKEHH